MSTEAKSSLVLVVLRILEKILDYVVDYLEDGKING